MTPFLTNAFQGMGSSAATSFGNAGGSGLGNALFGGIAARRQWKYQQKQMKLQQQYALEQMAKSAEYQLTHDKAFPPMGRLTDCLAFCGLGKADVK